MGANPLKGNFCAKTDIGRVRIVNEDQAKALANSRGDVLLLVCDGMGGGKKGDYASKFAIEQISEAFLNHPYRFSFLMVKNIVSGLKKTNFALFEQAQKEESYHNMGTTFIGALIRHHEIVIFNIGDSRCYGYEKKELSRYSDDQSYVEYLVKTGKIKQEEALTRPDRHILMNALGIYPTLSVDVQRFENRGQNILLCSDGLYNCVSEKDIARSLSTDESTVQKVDSLIELANLNGGSDNIALAYWEGKHD